MALAYWQLLAMTHAIIIGPLLVGLGVKGQSLPKAAFPAIAATGLAIGLYHGYRYLTNGFRPINMFHLLVVAPLIVYIGARAKQAGSFAFSLVTMLGFASIGYNTLNLVRYS